MHVYKDIAQGSALWRDIRKGRPTASNFDRIVTSVKGDPASPKTQESYMHELLGEAFCTPDDWQGNAYTDRGMELEPEAREAFAAHTGLQLDTVGFVLRDDYLAGCSPDSLIVGADGQYVAGLEIKCPMPKTHVSYVLGGVLPDVYKQQVHGSMVITGLPEWHFWSYFPGLTPIHVIVKRDHYTEKLAAGLEEFLERWAHVYAAAKQRLRPEAT